MAKRLQLELVVNDKGSLKIKQFGNQVKKSLSEANKDTKKLADSFAKFLAPSIGKATLSLVAAGAAIVKVSQIGMQFESVMKSVQAITQANADQYKILGDAALKMGATTEHSATQAAGALKFLSMAGLSVKDSITALPGMLDLATASQMELSTASDIVTDTLTAFGMKTEELTRLSDAFIATSTKTNTNVQMLGESFKYVAPIAAQMGYDVEQTASFLGIMANAGIKASDAGTDLRQALLRTGEAAKELGIEGASFNEVLRTMKERQLSANEVTDLFGMIASKSAMVLMNNVDAVEELNKKLVESQGITQKTASMMRDTAETDWKVLLSTVQDVALGLFEVFGPELRSALQSTTALVRENKGAFIELGGAVSQSFEAISVSIDIAREVLDAFRPLGNGIYQIFKFAFEASGKVIALFVYDIFETAKTIGDIWTDTGNIIYSAMIFNFSGIKSSWEDLVSHGSGLNRTLNTAWQTMTTDIASDWSDMTSMMSKSYEIMTSDIATNAQTTTDAIGANIDSSLEMNRLLYSEIELTAEETYQQKLALLDKEYEKRSTVATDIVALERWYNQEVQKLEDERIKNEVGKEEEKAIELENIYDDIIKTSLDASNEMLSITQDRVNKEVKLERDKAKEVTKMISEFGLGEITGRATVVTPETQPFQYRPKYGISGYGGTRWEKVPNPNYVPPAQLQSQEITQDLISTSNTHLKSISNTQDDMLREYERQTDILRDSFGSVSGLLEEMTFGGLAPTLDVGAFGVQYQGLLNIVKATTGEAQATAIKDFTSFVPKYLEALKSTSSDYTKIFNTIKKDIEGLTAGLTLEIVEKQMEILPAEINLADYLTIDFAEIEESINTGKLADAKEKMSALVGQLQDALPKAVKTATGIEGIEGFNLDLIGTKAPLDATSKNTDATVLSVSQDLIAISDMFSELTTGLKTETIPETIKAIRAGAAGAEPTQKLIQQPWTPITVGFGGAVTSTMWELRDVYGNRIGELASSDPGPTWIPAGRTGGLMSEPTIGGEAGNEWFVPTYEPERSNFLRDVGVDPDKIAAKVAKAVNGGQTQVISINIDGREIARAIAKQGNSSPELVKMIREVA